MRRPLALALLVLAVGPAGAPAQAPAPEDVVARCTSRQPDAPFRPGERGAVRRIAVCALAAARRARSPRLRTPRDAAVGRAARSALALAVALDGATAKNRHRVTRRVMARFPCKGAEGARVILADTSTTGGAATPLQLVRAVLGSAGITGPAALLGRATRLAVVVRPGRILAGGASGAVALALVGATCRP